MARSLVGRKPLKQAVTMGGLVLMLVILHPHSGLPFESYGDFSAIFNQGSRHCLGCHDGTLASNVVSQDLNAFSGAFQGTTASISSTDRGHPVGIDYRLAQLKSRGRLREPSSIDPAVKLENGQVGCTTCHDPNSPLRGKLVISNTGSRLCFSCHNL